MYCKRMNEQGNELALGSVTTVMHTAAPEAWAWNNQVVAPKYLLKLKEH